MALQFPIRRAPPLGSAYFDGTNYAYHNGGQRISTDGLPTTIATFARADSSPTTGVIFGFTSQSDFNNRLLMQLFTSGPDSQLRLRYHDGTLSDLNAVFNESIAEWRHCAATVEDGAMQVFVDGGETASASSTPTFTGSSSLNRTTLGAWYRVTSKSAYFTGRLSQTAAWDVVLTDEEIRALSEGTLPTQIRPNNLIRYVPGHEILPIDRALNVAYTHDTGSAIVASDLPPAKMSAPQLILYPEAAAGPNNQTLTEALSFTEDVTGPKVVGHTISEALALTDPSAIVSPYGKALIESLALTDAVLSTGGSDAATGGGASMSRAKMRRLELLQILQREDEELLELYRRLRR